MNDEYIRALETKFWPFKAFVYTSSSAASVYDTCANPFVPYYVLVVGLGAAWKASCCYYSKLVFNS